MKYRVKNILKDGRIVYWSKRNQIELISEEDKKWISNGPFGVYTKQLSLYGSEDLFHSEDIVPIIARIFEKETITIDKEAFILGGIKIKELNQ